MSHRLIIMLLILITLGVFCCASKSQFINYDDYNIFANPHVQQGLTAQNIAWAFTTTNTGYAQPLTWLSLMLDSDLMGTGPRGYHLANILLHALAVVLLYLALHALTAAPWRSALVALLFAIHPLRVESVAWVSEQKDVLSGCLAFATILAYALYAQRPNASRYLLVTVLFILGLLAKPMLVTLPCLLLLLDVWPLRRLASPPLPPSSPQAPRCPIRSIVWLIQEKVPLMALALADTAAAFIFQNKIGASPDAQVVPLAVRVSNIPISYVRYLFEMFWFRGLIVPQLFQVWSPWQVGGAMLLLILITVVVLWRFGASPWLAIGWFWYLGLLVPVLGLVGIAFPMADRFTYLPTIGLLIMLVWSLPDRLFQSKSGRMALNIATPAVLAILAYFTWHQIGYWQDSVTLFSHTVEYSPDNPSALLSLGLALDHDQGETQQAMDCYRRAIQAAPNFGMAELDLGRLQEQTGKSKNDPAMIKEGMYHLRRAAELPPPSAAAFNALGVADLNQMHLDPAMSEFRRATEIDPRFAPAHFYLGMVLELKKRYGEALHQYQLALNLDPDSPNDYYWAAEMLMKLGRSPEAIPYLQKAIQLDPGNLKFRAVLEKIQTPGEHSPRPSTTDTQP